MKENRRLPESELDIMLVVWNAGGGVSAPAILEGLERPPHRQRSAQLPQAAGGEGLSGL